ncbi:MAG: glycoside hydrolase family 9 protein [Maricaulaceae bacterium]
MRHVFIILAVVIGLTACGEQVSSEIVSVAEPTPHIVVDQFGYLPDLQKRAVLRNPKRGYDAGQTYQPGAHIELINKRTGKVVLTSAPRAWRNGAVHDKSGDQAWIFDFSSVTQAGRYSVRDPQNHIESYTFEISSNVYRPVLKAAFKSLYYQRAGYAKRSPYAARGFEDDASHLGRGQDSEARSFFDKDNAATARDLRGGWYDAGDYNKYTNWTSDYIISLLHSYQENPKVWGDDFDIPESGNGIPDILDEVKWGLDWLARMQNPDGSVLSVQGLAKASPPSAATEPSYYGPQSTSATLSGAAAFAYAAKVYKGPAARDYATRANKAWAWAVKNPNVIFKNNEASYQSEGLAAGQQEVDDKGRQQKWLQAALYLHVLTGDRQFSDQAAKYYGQLNPIDAYWFDPFEAKLTQSLVFYAKQPRTPRALKARILEDFKGHLFNSEPGLKAVQTEVDPYGSPLKAYTWGSNSVKSAKGSLFMMGVWSGIAPNRNRELVNAAANYAHYIHGVNPLGKTYLSNMRVQGAENDAQRFFHAWFKGRPPSGFLVGGPNPSYSADSCCPNRCGGDGNGLCRQAPLIPPSRQPDAKSYVDFNDDWPLNSWEVTENSLGYQTHYLRLISKLVD